MLDKSYISTHRLNDLTKDSLDTDVSGSHHVTSDSLDPVVLDSISMDSC